MIADGGARAEGPTRGGVEQVTKPLPAAGARNGAAQRAGAESHAAARPASASMRFSQACVEAIGYELPTQVVTSAAIEERLAPLYAELKLRPGQLEALTGVRERRYWPEGQRMSDGAVRAGRKALAASDVPREAIGMLIYGGVCRDQLEPATACAVACGLGLGPGTQVYDVSNACLGVLNGIVHVAGAIELGWVDAGLVVACESARPIVEATIERLLRNRTLEEVRSCLATLTGGSGAVAVVVARRSTVRDGHALLGGTARSDARYHDLCRWTPDGGVHGEAPQFMDTDSVGVLRHGVALGVETWKAFRRELEWEDVDAPDKIICHQVGSTHQDAILREIGVPAERDFTTFAHLGNMGTVSLPLTLAVARDRGFIARGDRVGLLGIGSGLNCLMLGVRW